MFAIIEKQLKKMHSYTNAVNDYVTYLDVSEATKRVYRYNISSFCMWLKRERIAIDNIGRKNFIEYKKYLVDNYESTFTIRNKFTMIKKFIDYLSNQGVLHSNVTYGVKRPKYEKRLCKMPLTSNEVSDLLKAIDTSRPSGMRDYCLVYLMIITGLRINEALLIQPGDINLEGDVYYIKIKGKGCVVKSQQVYFNHGMNHLLDDFIAEAVNEYLFSNTRDTTKNVGVRNMQRRIKSYFCKIGLSSRLYTTHSLRHTTATILLEQGLNIVDIQGYMRHTSVNTTQIYTSFMQDKKLKSLNVSSKINNLII